jgi:hypothetical protein
MLNVQERLENFYNKEIDNYNSQWSEKACDLIADVYAIGLNDKWCVARLENCEYVAIHKAIINKCRDLQDFWAISDSDKKVVKRLLAEHKQQLFRLLNDDIYNYCIR